MHCSGIVIPVLWPHIIKAPKHILLDWTISVCSYAKNGMGESYLFATAKLPTTNNSSNPARVTPCANRIRSGHFAVAQAKSKNVGMQQTQDSHSTNQISHWNISICSTRPMALMVSCCMGMYSRKKREITEGSYTCWLLLRNHLGLAQSVTAWMKNPQKKTHPPLPSSFQQPASILPWALEARGAAPN